MMLVASQIERFKACQSDLCAAIKIIADTLDYARWEVEMLSNHSNVLEQAEPKVSELCQQHAFRIILAMGLGKNAAWLASLSDKARRLERILTSVQATDEKILVLNRYRSDISAWLQDAKLAKLHHEMIRVLQMATFISPQNSFTDAGQLVSPISLEPMNDNRVFLASSGYILPLSDLIHAPQEVVRTLNYQALSKVEQEALALFEYRHITAAKPLWVQLMNHPMSKRIALTLAWAMIIAREVNQNCLGNPNYIESMNLLSQAFAKLQLQLVGSITQESQEMMMCTGAAVVKPSVLVSLLFCLPAIMFIWLTILDKINAYQQNQQTPRSSSELTIADCLTDFNYDKKAGRSRLLTIMDKLDTIAREHHSSRP